MVHVTGLVRHQKWRIVWDPILNLTGDSVRYDASFQVRTPVGRLISESVWFLVRFEVMECTTSSL